MKKAAANPICILADAPALADQIADCVESAAWLADRALNIDELLEWMKRRQAMSGIVVLGRSRADSPAPAWVERLAESRAYVVLVDEVADAGHVAGVDETVTGDGWRDDLSRELEALGRIVQRLPAATRWRPLDAIAHDGIFDWDVKADAVYYSPRLAAIFGCTSEELHGAPEDWLERIHEDDRDGFDQALRAHLEGEVAVLQHEHRILHSDGTVRWVSVRAVSERDGNRRATRLTGVLADVTERVIYEQQLRQHAYHDALTGLPNRTYFLEHLRRAIARTRRRRDYQFAVLFVDLDRFKAVNDSMGHSAGDQLLKAAAARFNECVRSVDTVARLGGDEFTILLDEVNDVSDATRVATRLQEAMSEPFRISDHDVVTTVSIGIALSVSGYQSAEELLRDADTAMYRAKEQGKARYELFDHDMHVRVVEQLQLESDLRRAVEGRQLTVNYQPIVSLDSGRLTGFESLVRWRDARRGLVSPADFIPVAEETGLVAPIDRWVLRQACRQQRQWMDRFDGQAPDHISVNLSSKALAEPDLVEHVAGTLSENDLPPERLTLEVVESALIVDSEQTQRQFRQLHELGVRLAIDDFGTGYSSLSYLRQYPFDVLKIDTSFVLSMHEDREHHEIVRTILSLARSLSLTVVAEGVESEQQLELLRQLHCDFGQGYYFSRPAPAEEVERLLAQAPSW